jgi:putative transposase
LGRALNASGTAETDRCLRDTALSGSAINLCKNRQLWIKCSDPADHSYQKRQTDKPDALRHQQMLGWVKDIAKFSENTYGERRIQKVLNTLSFSVSRRRTAQLIKEAQVWVQDITYVWTSQGWLYLAGLIYLYSRKVVAWSMSSRMKASLVCDALTMAIWQRQPKAGLIVHADQGLPYASNAYRRLIKTDDFVGSISKRGCCWDNALAEGFFRSLKQERVHWRNYSTRFNPQQDILNYMAMWYNSHRLHSYLAQQGPNDFERENNELQKVT